MARNQVTRHPPELDVAVPMDASHFHRLRERIRDYVGHVCEDDQQVADVVLAVDEAAANALRHSQTSDPFRIRLWLDEDRLRMLVEDQGVGFDTSTLDARRLPDPHVTGGRGLYLINLLMDEVRFSGAGGFTVRASKRLSIRHRAGHSSPSYRISPRHELDVFDGHAEKLLDELPEAFMALDWEWRIISMNRLAESYGLLSGGELAERTFWEAYPAVAGTDLERRLRECMELGHGSRLEFQDPGTGRWFDYALYPTRYGVGVYYCDVTARKGKELERDQLLEALRKSEERYRSIFENSWDAVLFTEAEGRVTGANAAACELFGMTEQELCRRGRSGLVDASSNEALVAGQMARARDGGARVELVLMRMDGRRFIADVSSIWIGDEGRGFVVIRDVTAKVQNQREAAEENALLTGVRRILEAALSSDTEDELGAVCLRVARELTGSEIGFIGEQGADGLLQSIAISDPAWESCGMQDQSGHRRRPVDVVVRDLYARVLSDGRTLVTNDPPSHPGSAGVPDDHPRVRAFLGTPLTSRGARWGLIALGNRPGGYGDEQVRVLEALAPVVVQAFERRRVENVRECLLEQLREQSAELQTQAGRLRGQAAELRGQNRELQGQRDENSRLYMTVRADERRQTAIMNNSLAGLEYLDRDFIIRYVNTAFERNVGKPSEQLVGINHMDVFPDAGLRRFLEQARDSGRSSEFKAVPMRMAGEQSGPLSYWDWKVTPVVDDDGVTSGLVVSSMNVSDEVQAARLSDALNRIDHRLAEAESRSQGIDRAIELAATAVDCQSVWVASLEQGRWETLRLWNLSEEELPPPEAAAEWPTQAFESLSPSVVSDWRMDVRVSAAWKDAWKIQSCVFSPFMKNRTVTGGVFFGFRRPGRRFGSRELAFMRRCSEAFATAFENVRLVGELQRSVITLQQNLIHPLPAVAGLELAVISEPANRPDLVGGDFHDAFMMSDGRVALVIGDVAGKGLEAAGVTESVRTAIRAFASVGGALGTIVERTNDLMLADEVSPASFVTLLLMTIHPKTGAVEQVSAGHPPPIIGAGRACRFMAMSSGPPLGTWRSDYAESNDRLTPGQCLVLYTDGVTEARTADGLFGERRLIAVARSVARPTAHVLADEIYGAVSAYAGGLRDDLEIMVVRFDPSPAGPF